MKYKSKISTSILVTSLILSIFISFGTVNAELVTYSYTLNPSWSLDVDTGTSGTMASMDIWNTGTPAALIAQNGAVMASSGSEDFASVCDASQYTYDITSISTLSLSVGDIYLIRTNIGNYAKFRIDSVSGPTVGITVTYQDDGGTDLCGSLPHTVGGIYAPINKLNILAPYFALVSLIGVISMIFAIRRWYRD